MILQVKNMAGYDQPITLHTGEAKTVMAGQAIKINTGADKRLLSYYASLVNYNFEVTSLEASSQEINSLEDAIQKINSLKRSTEKKEVLQESKSYPSPVDAYVAPNNPVVEPVTLDKVFNNEPITKVVQTPIVEENVIPQTPAPKTTEPVTIPNQRVTLVEETLEGTNVVADFTPQLPDDYPEDPHAVAELAKIEAQEKAVKDAQTEKSSASAQLEELDESTLKKILYEVFEEQTKLRSKWKLVNHIIELIEDSDVTLDEIMDKYSN